MRTYLKDTSVAKAKQGHSKCILTAIYLLIWANYPSSLFGWASELMLWLFLGHLLFHPACHNADSLLFYRQGRQLGPIEMADAA